MAEGEVVFGNKQMAVVLGILGGVIVAAGLPTMVLLYGQNMGVAAQLTVIILALLIGGALAGVSAFFAIVIPSSVGGKKVRGNLTINLGKDKNSEAAVGTEPGQGQG